MKDSCSNCSHYVKRFSNSGFCLVDQSSHRMTVIRRANENVCSKYEENPGYGVEIEEPFLYSFEPLFDFWRRVKWRFIGNRRKKRF